MPDDPNERGKPDQDRVSQQQHEVDRLVEKTGQPEAVVREKIAEDGPLTPDVEDALNEISAEEKKGE